MIQRIQGLSASCQQLDLGRAPDVGPHRFGASASGAEGGVVQLTLSGDIDLAVSDRLRDIVRARLAGRDLKALLIDMAAVTFLDCSGIGVLVAGRHLAADVGCGYQVVKATGNVAWVLDLTGVRLLLELPLAGAAGRRRADLPRQRQGGLG